MNWLTELPDPYARGLLSLNELDYDWPAGFARFVLEARDPNVATLAQPKLQALEHVLECRLRVIWAHY